MLCNRVMTRRLVALLPFVIACATSDPCLDAEQRFASCGLSTPAGFGDLCRSSSPDSISEVLQLPCDELSMAVDQLGKSDLPGFDRGEGEPCVFNLQCDSEQGLFCRPLESTVGVSSQSVPHQCLLYGMSGDFCDDSSDCQRGDPCTLGQCAIKDRGGH